VLPGYRLIDLSVPLEHKSAGEPLPAQIRYDRHDGEGLRQMRQLLGVKPEDLVYSGGLSWAVEEGAQARHPEVLSRQQANLSTPQPRATTSISRLDRYRTMYLWGCGVLLLAPLPGLFPTAYV
jgi:hypothetical protein